MYITWLFCCFKKKSDHNVYSERKGFQECHPFTLKWRRESFFLTNLQGIFKKFRGQSEKVPPPLKHGYQGCPCFAQRLGHGIIDLTLILVLFSSPVCFLQEFPYSIFQSLSPGIKKKRQSVTPCKNLGSYFKHIDF